jgi:hypothetical protein
MQLQTYHVEDWGEFIDKESIDLQCPKCKGKGTVAGNDDAGKDLEDTDCEECSGSGYIEPMWNTIWNTGFHFTDGSMPREVGTVFAFNWDGHIWFGLTGCGMDLTPHLAQTWMTIFPQCDWLPEQFIVEGCNLRGGYVESCLGKKDARKVYALIAKSIKGMRRQAANLAQDLKAVRQHMARKVAK